MTMTFSLPLGVNNHYGSSGVLSNRSIAKYTWLDSDLMNWWWTEATWFSGIRGVAAPLSHTVTVITQGFRGFLVKRKFLQLLPAAFSLTKLREKFTGSSRELFWAGIALAALHLASNLQGDKGTAGLKHLKAARIYQFPRLGFSFQICFIFWDTSSCTVGIMTSQLPKHILPTPAQQTEGDQEGFIIYSHSKTLGQDSGWFRQRRPINNHNLIG